MRALVRGGKPVVLFDRLLPDVQADAIVVDGLTGMYEATRHLLDQGYAHPALVTIRSVQSQLLARRRGYAQALRRAKPARAGAGSQPSTRSQNA